MRFYIEVSGAKVYDLDTGYFYWWPDEESSPSGPLDEGWVELGYTTEGVEFK